MIRIMIDIETLSTHDDAAVIAIGLAAFNDHQILGGKEILVDPRFSPGHRDPETIAWWEDQDPKILTVMMSGLTRPEEACGEVDLFLNGYIYDELWANPPQFDVVILKNLFKSCGKKWKGEHWQERDFRTMKNLAKQLELEPFKEKNLYKHSALRDAVHQAKQLMHILAQLR